MLERFHLMEKIFTCIKNIGVWHSFKKNKTATMFFFKKTFSSLICSLGQHFTDIKGSKYMLVHSLASKYARFVILVRLMYWTPPPSDHWTPPF